MSLVNSIAKLLIQFNILYIHTFGIFGKRWASWLPSFRPLRKYDREKMETKNHAVEKSRLNKGTLERGERNGLC